MKILFIGSYIPENIEEEYKKYSSVAGNKFQKNFINSLKEFDVNLDVLSYIQYPLFSKENKVIIPCNIKKSEQVNYIRYINLPIIKEISIFMSTLLFICQNYNKYTHVITYNLFPPYLRASNFLRVIFNYKLGSIVADLYIDEYGYESNLKRIKKRRAFKREIKLLNELDFCIPITKYIIKDFNFNKPSIVLEGGVDIIESIDNTNKAIDKLRKRRITYTGSIDSVNGIEILIEVIKLMEDTNFEFIIVGDGPLLEKLKNETKNNNNVNILGKISNQQVIEIQKKSDLLILTRPSNQKITHYTFPSKLHEYMNSETPVLITKLKGIDEEYYKYVNIIDKNEPLNIVEDIINIFENYDEVKGKAIDGKEYLINNKNWRKQAEKVFEFMKKL